MLLYIPPATISHRAGPRNLGGPAPGAVIHPGVEPAGHRQADDEAVATALR